ncbi:MAG TPA: CBS domain-containing protein [Polyangiaceae bacterium]|nr:CBS domain-containing protein [Polyangiaceae bacterium]
MSDHSSAIDTPVSAVMTKDVVCVSGDLPAERLEQLFIDRGISGAPVTDGAGRPIGVVTKTDLVAWKHTGKKTVADLMTPRSFSVGTNEPLARAAGLMAYEGMHRVTVVAEDGRVVGVVTALDVLRWLARDNGFPIANRP